MDESEILVDVDPDEARRVGDDLTSEAVVRAVADVRNLDPIDLPPLHGVIDPDALDALFADTIAGSSREGRLVFEYGGCTVALRSPDRILVDVSE